MRVSRNEQPFHLPSILLVPIESNEGRHQGGPRRAKPPSYAKKEMKRTIEIGDKVRQRLKRSCSFISFNLKNASFLLFLLFN